MSKKNKKGIKITVIGTELKNLLGYGNDHAKAVEAEIRKEFKLTTTDRITVFMVSTITKIPYLEVMMGLGRLDPTININQLGGSTK